MRRCLPLVVLLLFVSSGCERATERPARSEAAGTPSSTAGRAAAPLRVVVLGDSLTAGLGVREEEAYPALLEAELRRRGWAVDVVNAGVSGDTTAGGRSRLAWLLRQRPEILVVSLGANDGLRGLPVSEMEDNLRAILEAGAEAGARALLTGMRVPPNYGPEYSARFAAVFPRLAAEFGVPLVPFLLEGVGGEPELNQADGIHPNAAGQRIIAAHLVDAVEALVRRAAGERPA